MAFEGTDVVKALIVRGLRFMGLALAVLAWVVILLAVSRNPWFVFTRHAFSDLGAPRAEDPWIFNNGLIGLGLLMLIYSLTLIGGAINKAETVGGAFTFVAGVFLALIGVYPSGTEPHGFVSAWFFVQADLAVIAWGAGLLLGPWRVLGALIVGMSVLGPLGAWVVEWPSVAALEAFGMVLIDVWVVLVLRVNTIRAKRTKLLRALERR